jgi:hypothetical protein
VLLSESLLCSCRSRPIPEEASFDHATRHDPSLAGFENRASSVEPEPIHLLRGTMTTDAIFLKDGQDISTEIDFVESLSVNTVCERRHQKKYNRGRVPEHDASCRISPDFKERSRTWQ